MDLDLLLHPPRATMAEAVAALCSRQLWARLANDRHYLLCTCGRVWADPNDPNRYRPSRSGLAAPASRSPNATKSVAVLALLTSSAKNDPFYEGDY
jgi:hypothetical protein